MADLDGADLAQRFTYHPPTGDQPAAYEELRGRARAYAEILAVLCPPSRERSLAVTHLEETVMWANAAVARHGLQADLRHRPIFHLPARDPGDPWAPWRKAAPFAVGVLLAFVAALLTLGFMLVL